MADISITTARKPRSAAEPVEAGPAAQEPCWDLIELLFFAYRDFVGDPDEVLAKLGFGRAHHRVLHFVNRNPDIKVADLLDILKITKQSLGRVLKLLIDEGYVVQRAGPHDRRQRLLYASEAGEALALRLRRPRPQSGVAPDQKSGPCRASGPGGRLMTAPAATPSDDAPHLLVVDDDRRIR